MTGVRIRLIMAAATAAAAFACVPESQPPASQARVVGSPTARASQAAPAAAPGRRRSDLPRAVTPDGTVLKLELALTPEEISQGLMFRPSLAADRGMLFVFPQPRHPSFWMFNTWIPLDMVFLDASGVVVHVEENAQPCPSEPCPKYIPDEPAKAVLEINAGAAAKLGLAEGALLRVENVSGFPSVAVDR